MTTKVFVQQRLQQFTPLYTVKVATTANVSLATGSLLTVDGVALASGDRVLVRAQTTASENGIYVASLGSWSRSAEVDLSSEVSPGLLVTVQQGTTYADTLWIHSTNAPITLGTTSITFGQLVSGGGGGGSVDVKEANSVVTSGASAIDFDGTSFNVATAPAGEANVTMSFGTSAGQPAEGNHAQPTYYKWFRSGSAASSLTGTGWEYVHEARTIQQVAVVYDTPPTDSTTVKIQKRTGLSTATDIVTVSVTANDYDTLLTGLTVAVVAGDQMRIQVSAGGTASQNMFVSAKAA